VVYVPGVLQLNTTLPLAPVEKQDISDPDSSIEAVIAVHPFVSSFKRGYKVYGTSEDLIK